MRCADRGVRADATGASWALRGNGLPAGLAPWWQGGLRARSVGTDRGARSTPLDGLVRKRLPHHATVLRRVGPRSGAAVASPRGRTRSSPIPSPAPWNGRPTATGAAGAPPCRQHPDCRAIRIRRCRRTGPCRLSDPGRGASSDAAHDAHHRSRQRPDRLRRAGNARRPRRTGRAWTRSARSFASGNSARSPV